MCKLTHTTPTFITEALCLVACVQLFKGNIKSESNGLYSDSLLLLGWFIQHASTVRPRPSSIMTTAAI